MINKVIRSEIEVCNSNEVVRFEREKSRALVRKLTKALEALLCAEITYCIYYKLLDGHKDLIIDLTVGLLVALSTSSLFCIFGILMFRKDSEYLKLEEYLNGKKIVGFERDNKYVILHIVNDENIVERVATPIKCDDRLRTNGDMLINMDEMEIMNKVYNTNFNNYIKLLF